ncbi:hypothetical protein CPB84DRAFT_1762381 [Gymnopilus junonius]|uniref:Uncharacterized protein n=1 Tax=Gymnopilus junonius TaxID=109634 RepID=A0A9P5NZN1_GYMJU|nr:hypothetical protein CPB84DRAFT_1762381 [Gymnopilus junonius]
MSASPAESSSKPANAKSRNRLSAEGVAILQAYWDVHPGEMPSVSMRKTLTEEIKKTPGNEFYKILNTTSWFKRRIEEIRKAASVHVDPRFPSLSAGVLEHLDVLLKNQPNPSPDVIKTWATLIAKTGASYQDVVAWAHLTMRNNHADHLPTPANTVSPEPSNQKPTFTSMSPTQTPYPTQAQTMGMKKSPTQSPMLPPSLSIRTGQSQGSPTQWRPYYHPSPVSPSSSFTQNSAGNAHSQPNRAPTLQEAIIQGVADAVASPALTTPPDVLPSNAAEFNAMFAPYEKQLSQLMRALESS